MSTTLVVSALREFWPDSGKVWLVSPGCLADAETGETGQTRQVAGMVSDPFSSGKSISLAYKEIWRIANDVIALLSDRLNVLHGVKHSEAYWRTHIGFWALLYVSVIFDRYSRLSIAAAEMEQIQLIGLDERDSVTPADTIDFVHKVTSDLYNQQIYTALAHRLGIPVSCNKRAQGVRSTEREAVSVGQLINKRVKLLGQFCYAGWCSLFARNADVLMVHSYLPRKFEAVLWLSSAGKIAPLYARPGSARSSVPKNEVMRSQLSVVPPGVSERITALAIELAGICIPKAFVEEYQHVYAEAQRLYGRYRPKVIYSASAWWFDEPFKNWAALSREKGAILVGAEHGSAAFIGKYKLSEQMEMQIADYFVTWGWASPTEPKVVSLPANKLINIRKRRSENLGNGILYVATAQARHNVGMLEAFHQYVDWQGRFFRAVPRRLDPEFLVRLYQLDYGWEMKRRLVEISAELRFDHWRYSFRNRLKTSRLVVFDYVSTTFAEAMAANVPCILFFDQNIYPVELEMVQQFRALKEANILHETPESAATWVNHVYKSPAAWWQSRKCQQVVRDFCAHYARQHEAALPAWKAALEAFALQRNRVERVEKDVSRDQIDT